MAVDNAREAKDHYAATAVLVHAQRAPAVRTWLASIQATIHADSGDHTAAAEALRRAAPLADQQPHLVDHGSAQLAGVTGHTYLRAGDHTAARSTLAAALDQLPRTDRRARVLTLTDLATAEPRAGNIPDACRHATTAADLLQRLPYATGTARLRAFRNLAARPIGPRALRVLDEHLAQLAA